MAPVEGCATRKERIQRGECPRITPPPPKSNRNPVSTLYKIRTHSTPSKGAYFPSNQCKIAVHSAPHQLSVGGWCGDYNANFSIGCFNFQLFK